VWGLSQSYPGIWLGRLKKPTKYLNIFDSLDADGDDCDCVTWLMCTDGSEHTRTFSGHRGLPFIGSSYSSFFLPNTSFLFYFIILLRFLLFSPAVLDE
jgi:hypothetical protein